MRIVQQCIIIDLSIFEGIFWTHRIILMSPQMDSFPVKLLNKVLLTTCMLIQRGSLTSSSQTHTAVTSSSQTYTGVTSLSQTHTGVTSSSQTHTAVTYQVLASVCSTWRHALSQRDYVTDKLRAERRRYLNMIEVRIRVDKSRLD